MMYMYKLKFEIAYKMFKYIVLMYTFNSNIYILFE